MLTSIKEIIFSCFVFCIILFLYLHTQFHLKTSNELEIYEVDQASKEKMEEICDLRQPVLFDDEEYGKKIISTTNKTFLLNNYPVFEIKIRDIIDISNESDLYLPLPIHLANKLFDEDDKSKYFSEGNYDFLLETGALKNMTFNDGSLRPSLVSNCYYDVLMGSNQVETPFRYELNYRNYFIVTQGSIRVKLSPPKSYKYLHPINDYENFEFKSPINPWNPQDKFITDFDKIKCLEIVLTPGRFLFIPAYWWYSFKFEKNSSVSCFKYRTYMNNLAICPNIFMYALQNQNIERKIAKKIDIKNLESTNKIKMKDNFLEEEECRIHNLGSKSESLLTNSLIPDSLIPKGLIPDSLIPEALIPDSLIPEALIPDSLIPNSLIPEILIPNPSTITIYSEASI
uniref:JmjC domain-containing protein n=1 Tax=viral metagenome TaxID=1070528 RepID=A0A6C0KSF5_9ZZZZ